MNINDYLLEKLDQERATRTLSLFYIIEGCCPRSKESRTVNILQHLRSKEIFLHGSGLIAERFPLMIDHVIKELDARQIPATLCCVLSGLNNFLNTYPTKINEYIIYHGQLMMTNYYIDHFGNNIPMNELLT